MRYPAFPLSTKIIYLINFITSRHSLPSRFSSLAGWSRPQHKLGVLPTAMLDLCIWRGGSNFRDKISYSTTPGNDPICHWGCEQTTTLTAIMELKVNASDVFSYSRQLQPCTPRREDEAFACFISLAVIYLFVYCKGKVHVFYTKLISLVLSFYVLSS